MSLATAMVRIAELDAALAPAPAATASAAPAASTGFAQTLQAATQPNASAPYSAEIQAAATRYGVDPNLISAVIGQESGFNPNATSTAGAAGLMQLMPATAQGLGVTNPYDPVQSIDGGTQYLKSMLDRFGGDTTLALAAYNAGPNAVASYGGVPPYPETQAYVSRILATVGRV
ncbi:MAG TPA: lytic transglycosylase domain-containing protein [Gaiellaceae bacterium]|nr:lytic transglycosylase domain-containing protein [Gaiellaceae bacterium]